MPKVLLNYWPKYMVKTSQFEIDVESDFKQNEIY